jgi:RNA polymerase sigma-70 factor (ECF subfamily)
MMEIQNQLTETAELWIEKATQGDLDAFNQLVLKYQNLVYHQAFSILKDTWLAEEASQESFLKAFQNLNGFRGGSFRAWLMRIVTNTVYDMLRYSSKRPVQPLFPENDEGEEIESPIWLADPNAKVEETIELNEELKQIYQTLDELPVIYREVINLIDLQDFDYDEAAQALRVPIGTVKSRLARARMQIKESLKNKKDFGRSINDVGLCLAV